jgi:hypothetical protein
MTPIPRTVPSTSARRRAAAHRAAEGTVTAYLRELSSAAHSQAAERRGTRVPPASDGARPSPVYNRPSRGKASTVW